MNPKIKIITHRGFWMDKSEQNTLLSFHRSFVNGYGIETDLRDFNGGLVISHDIANNASILLDDFLKMYKTFGLGLTIAFNIKSDGLASLLLKKLNDYNLNNYFVFDMSIPDTISYLDKELVVFTRQSEYEIQPMFYNQIKGIWLDAFEKNWYSKELIVNHIMQNKLVAIVSPELHKRPYIEFWNWFKENELHLLENILLCTDYPEEAKLFFYD